MMKYLNTTILIIIVIILGILVLRPCPPLKNSPVQYEYTVTELYPTSIVGREVLQHPFYKNLNQGWEPITTFFLSSNNTTWCIMRRPKPAQ